MRLYMGHVFVMVGITLMLWATPSPAWHGSGHELIARTAMAAMPEALPEFFRQGADTVAHTSVDPDSFTRPMAPRELHAAVAPDHYLDIEMIEGVVLPATRYEFLKIVYDRKLQPDKVGLLPYAIVESTQRLTVAFAEYRRWPNDPVLREQCLIYAGHLSHYAADLCQPLHTTIHFDGRVGADGVSPRSGIHLKLDAAMGKLDVDPTAVGKKLKVEEMADLLKGVMDEFNASHALVDSVYQMESSIPGYDAPMAADNPTAVFCRDRLKTAGRFTASLIWTAWRNSSEVKIPSWHVRPSISPEKLGKPSVTTQPTSSPVQ